MLGTTNSCIRYSTIDVMHKKLLYAIHNGIAIDADSKSFVKFFGIVMC